VQLIFGRRITRRADSRFRTRVITDAVLPPQHVACKRSRIKQHYKEGRALRTKTVINDTYDFGAKRRLRNLDDLKEVGFKANRRLLDVQRISHDRPIGLKTFDALHRPPFPAVWGVHESGFRRPGIVDSGEARKREVSEAFVACFRPT